MDIKIIVDSFDRFGELAEFDTETGELTQHPEWARDSQQWQQRVGFFSIFTGGIAALFRIGSELFLFAQGRIHPLADDAFGKVEAKGSGRRFTLTGQNGDSVFIDYCVPSPPIPSELDFTAARPEDFDFFLFVTQLLQNPGRRRLYRGLPGD